jgi:hypothetical protein
MASAPTKKEREREIEREKGERERGGGHNDKPKIRAQQMSASQTKNSKTPDISPHKKSHPFTPRHSYQTSIKIAHLTEHSSSLLHLIQILHIWFFSKDQLL